MTSTRIRWPTAAGTLAIAAGGGFCAKLLGLPLPWLVGAQIALCIVALARVDIFGAKPQWPRVSRDIFLPVLGVMIGGSFSPDMADQAQAWWASLLVLSVFILVVHGLVFAMFRRMGRYDLPTAFYASFPGGFIEAALLGAEAGGNQRVIVVQHFLRVSLIVFFVPLIFWILRGEAVGSAAGVMSKATEPAGSTDFAVLAAAGLVGTLISRWLNFPARDISGAMAASAIVHMVGWADGGLPPVLIALTQLMIGTTLGVGFSGVSRQEILRAIGLAIPAFAVTVGAAGLVGLVLHGYVGVSTEAMLLAFAPGGLPEMSLIALSLQASVPFVALHHLYRIFFTMTVLPQIYGLVSRA